MKVDWGIVLIGLLFAIGAWEMFGNPVVGGIGFVIAASHLGGE